MNTSPSPFHAGEQAMQSLVGVREVMEARGRQVIRDHMPDQHRDFFAALPFIVIGALDAKGHPWATVMAGPPGFMDSPDPQVLVANGKLIRDVRLDRYLAAHKQFAGTSALGVPSGFLRSATADAADR